MTFFVTPEAHFRSAAGRCRGQRSAKSPENKPPAGGTQVAASASAVRNQGPAGFTLIEILIAVVIVTTLGLVAIRSYRRYLDQARTSEAAAVLAEIRTREEAYRAEFSTYLSLSANENDFWPVLGSGEPRAKNWQPAPTPWAQLGVNPGKQQVYCGYNVIAGAAGAQPTGTRGGALFPTASALPWWYATAACDNDGDPSINALYVTSSESVTISEQNAHR